MVPVGNDITHDISHRPNCTISLFYSLSNGYQFRRIAYWWMGVWDIVI